MDERLIPYAHMHRWEWNGIVLLEPSTVFTNLLIALMCFYAWRMLRKDPELSLPQRLANWFFFAMGFATIIGGVIGHGFLYVTGQAGKLPGWMISMVAVALFERSAIQQSRMLMKPEVGRFFSILNYAEIGTLAMLAIITLNFHFVEGHAAYGLLVVVFSFTYFTWMKTRAPYCRQIFKATLMGAFAALFHALKIDVAYWFNYNDISHLFMVAGTWYYYKGVRDMRQIYAFIDADARAAQK